MVDVLRVRRSRSEGEDFGRDDIGVESVKIFRATISCLFGLWQGYLGWKLENSGRWLLNHLQQ